MIRPAPTRWRIRKHRGTGAWQVLHAVSGTFDGAAATLLFVKGSFTHYEVALAFFRGEVRD